MFDDKKKQYFIGEKLLNTKIREIMVTPVIKVDEHDDFSVAQEKFINHRVNHLIVVNGANEPVGILSRKYLYKVQSPRKIQSEDQYHQPDLVVEGDSFYLKETLDSYILRNVMARNPLVLRADDYVKDAIANMTHKRIGCIPIIDEDNKLCGVLTSEESINFTATILED